jgi:4-hydroxyphenylpyruvate dioxygenase-like putative hemolysin
VWDILIEVIPKLHNVPVERSFTLNDDRQEKRQKAKLFYSIGFLPRDPGVGHLAMAVKQIEETVTVLQQKDLEGLKRLLDGYERVYSHISELEQDLTKLAPPKNKKG